MSKEFKMIGTTDEADGCEHCGRENVERFVVVENTVTGEILKVGCVCASKLLNRKVTMGEANKIQAERDRERKARFAKALNKHPLMVQRSNEMNQATKDGIFFKERKEKGLLDKWRQLEEQAKIETQELLES